MSTVPLEIEADVVGRRRAGRGACAARSTWPRRPGASPASGSPRTQPPACPEAVAAVREADWVVLGPGSWFTSVLPHLLVPGARRGAGAHHGAALPGAQPGRLRRETAGSARPDHLAVLSDHVPGLRFDAVLADPGSIEDVDATGRRRRRPRRAAGAAPGRHRPRQRPARPAAPGRRPARRPRAQLGRRLTWRPHDRPAHDRPAPGTSVTGCPRGRTRRRTRRGAARWRGRLAPDHRSVDRTAGGQEAVAGWPAWR